MAEIRYIFTEEDLKKYMFQVYSAGRIEHKNMQPMNAFTERFENWKKNTGVKHILPPDAFDERKGTSLT